MYKYIILALSLIVVVSCSELSEFDMNNEKISELIRQGSDTIQLKQHFPDQDVRKYLHTEFNEFYKNRDYKLAWLTFDEPTEAADELLIAIDNARYDGLNPENYDLTEIEKLMADVYAIETSKKDRKKWRKKLLKRKQVKNEIQEKDTLKLNKLARVDFLMTSAYLTYASHLEYGLIDPDENKEWYAEREHRDLSAHLDSALRTGDIKASLEAMEPNIRKYKELKAELKKHMDLKNAGGFPKVVKVKKGDKGAEVLALAQRLNLTGDLAALDSADITFDDEITEALKNFQYRHSMATTGKMDDETLEKLNKPIDHWIGQIQLTMEQLRWIKNDFEGKYVLVNIPAYQLEVINNDKIEFDMKVIVGKTMNPTPVFSDEMEYIVFRPTWTVPQSIINNEMLPRIKSNPGYLTSRNFSVYNSWNANAKPLNPYKVNWNSGSTYRIVQNPGPSNALGLVKFIFPNDNNVYLHDTPTDYLFNRADRNFSHGCMRVERPAEFASYLLGWDLDKVKEKMSVGGTETVSLEKKLPVHIVYWTAWIDADGKLRLLDDIYNRDKRKKQKLEKEDALAVN